MKNQLFQSMLSAVFTAFLFFASFGAAKAAPGNLGHIPLFVAPPTQPNIFFMLDDSGSMGWNLRTTGGGSISFSWYVLTPASNEEWRTWCLGANALAYNPAITYKPWAGNIPGVTPPTPFPDQILTSAWAEPMTRGVGAIGGGTSWVGNWDTGTVDLSNVPVVQWTDDDNDGLYDNNECAYSFVDAPRGRVTPAGMLSTAEQINFANWFTYYRDRDRTVSAAVTQVIANSTARIGMATLHNNHMIGGIDVGKKVEDMTDPVKKNALLYDVANIRPSGGTPLRTRLNWVGQYFDKATATAPSGLNIGTAPSPILSVANGGECQQNFVMLMSDGIRNGGTPSVGHQDQDTSNPYVYKAHKDDRDDDLADVAMKWYKTDLASTYANKVVVQTGANSQNLDDNNQQHLVTFTVAFGLSDSLTNPVDRTQTHNWPAGSLADMRHAAYNGRGEFLSAGNAETLISSLQTVISNIESRQGSAAAVSFSSTSLVSGTSLFFASFDTVGWKGDLRSLSIDPVTGDLGVLPLWNAASLLDSKTNADIANRAIYTWGLDTAAANNGVLFDWGVANPQPASTILDDFKKNQDTSIDLTPFTATQARLDYVRGDTSTEGIGLIRSRGSRLGDIINSPPHSVASPISNWPNTGSPFSTYSTLYSDYQAAQLLRQGMVYVGANDGMLHGFNASTGEEVFAYVPSSPASANDNDGLHYLTESDYQHKYYVDGSPISADVFLRTEPSTAQDWKTILVGSLRGGGRGIYALDVTDPTAFSNTQAAAKNVVMWEFTDQDDSDLGFTFSEPQITMMNNGEWAVIVGNGYNATGTDTAKLMILFIERGVDGQWTAGDYIKLDTGVGINGNKNGLSTPTLIDLNSDGKTDRIYAGDLYGNMWAFDVTDSLEANWQIAHQDTAGTKIPLFTATHHTGSPAAQVLATPTPQPITMKPLVVKPSWVADTGSNTPNVIVYFGTGQYIATGDATNADQQTFYGVWDAGITPASGSASSVSPTKLVEQTFLAGFPISARVLSHNNVNYHNVPSTGDLGWFINLPETGERVVVDAFQLQGLVFFNTLTPSSAPCSAGGASWLMAVNGESGANPAFAAFDLTGDRVLNSADQVSDGTTTAYAAGVVFGHGIASASSIITNDAGASFAFISGTDSDTPHRYDLPSGGAGGPPVSGARKSWLQLFN